jgi:origin recognition complex subunit 4
VVLGVSSRMDAAELLEKRVLSRFSHRKLIFSSLGDGVEPALQLLRDVLRVVPPPADPASAAKAAYVRSFNQAVDTTLASTSVKQLLELPVGLDASPRAVCDLAAAALGHMSRATGVLRPEDVQFAVTERLRGSLSTSLAGCSVLELWMLVAMHRLRTWRNRPAASFNEAWAECTGTVGAAAHAVEVRTHSLTSASPL